MNCHAISTQKSYQNSYQISYRWSRASKEDQSTHVRSALIAQRAGGIKQSADAVGLDGRADKRCTPCCAGGGGLLRFEELFLGVGGLGLAVGLAEEWAEDGEGGGVVEDGAERDR